jgi:hypothetical protein
MAVKMSMLFFLVVTMCGLIGRYQHFGEMVGTYKFSYGNSGIKKMEEQYDLSSRQCVRAYREFKTQKGSQFLHICKHF